MLQCFEFHDKHGRNRRKERICFDHEQVRDQNKCVLRRLIRAGIQAWAIVSRVMSVNHGAWLDHEVSPAYFKLTAWIAANVYAYVHGHTRTRQPDQSL